MKQILKGSVMLTNDKILTRLLQAASCPAGCSPTARNGPALSPRHRAEAATDARLGAAGISPYAGRET